MIVDGLPINPTQVTFVPFVAPVVALKSTVGADRYTFNARTVFRAQGGCLYLFDGYTAAGSISEAAFVAGAAAGAVADPTGVTLPRFSVSFPAVQGGRPTGFPSLQPAFFGFSPTRIWAMAPKDATFEIAGTVDGTFYWDAAAGAAPASVSFLYSLFAYQVKDARVIELYNNGALKL